MKTVEKRASDNQYLHKDFHGALSYAISYLEENFGQKGIRQYLRQVAENAFSPLIEEIKKDGLAAVERHYRKIFELENGDFVIKRENDCLKLTVRKCPAIHHIKEINQFHTTEFCLTTIIVNERICELAGLKFSCKNDIEKGACEQIFRRDT